MNHLKRYTYNGVLMLYKHPGILLLMVLLPLVMGSLYGIMYQQLLNTGAEALPAGTHLASSGLVKLLEAPPALSSSATMQLSVFSGLTFFLVSFWVYRFIRRRAQHMTHRLIAIGYSEKHVFWGEAITYLAGSFTVIVIFHLSFLWVNGLPLPSALGQFIGLMGLQSIFASAYALMALGLFRKEKTFNLYHFYPALVLSFLGGAMFPVEAVSTGGLYEYMPTYLILSSYRTLYTQQAMSIGDFLSLSGILLGFALVFVWIGRMRFILREVS